LKIDRQKNITRFNEWNEDLGALEEALKSAKK